jgi:Iap family predicted aminopeptidase
LLLYMFGHSSRLFAQRGFLKLGIPTVDIIDLDYGPLNLYWHTPYDTPDRCSAASLAIVGAVVRGALSPIKFRVPLCYTTAQR